MGGIAISYARFSSPGQASGDSVRRQTEALERYLKEHDLTLDDRHRFLDPGISGYTGDNVREGALGKFLELVRQGQIPHGATLIIESFDRLSRATVADALPVFLEILKAGIVVVTLIDNQRYSRESVGDNVGQLMYSLIAMQRAYDESHTKSVRVGAAWANKKNRARNTGEIMTRKVPHWINAELVADSGGKKQRRLRLDPERAKVALGIIEDAERGLGNHTIVRRLNSSGIPAWGWQAQRKNKPQPAARQPARWTPSYLQKILTSPALYGAIELDDQLIEGYYPPLIDRDRALLLNRLRTNRATTTNRNRKGKSITNLFTGLMKCGYCGCSMNIAGYKSRVTGYERKYVACHGARTATSTCKMKMWFLDELEPTLLFWLTQVDYNRLLAGNHDGELFDAQKTLATLTANVDAAKMRVENIARAIEEGAPGLVPRLKDRGVELHELEVTLRTQEKLVRALESRSASRGRMTGLVAIFKALKTTTDELQLRLLREQLMVAIGGVVEVISLFPAGHTISGGKADRFIDIRFRNGEERRIEAQEC